VFFKLLESDVIRAYQTGDHLAVANIFSDAVHQIAREVYTEEQCLAWASKEVNYEHWEKRCELKRPFVSVMDGQIAGFLELDPDGHIDCAYVNPQFKRQGVMTSLLKHAIHVCFSSPIGRMYVDASICAKPLFEKHGFRVIRENMVQIGQVQLLNYKMELLKKSP